MQKNGFHENVSYNSFALSPRFELVVDSFGSRRGADYSKVVSTLT